MIEIKISGLKVADYWSPTDGWNYDAIDSLAKELYDRYREAEAEQTVELFKNYIERMSILHEIDLFLLIISATRLSGRFVLWCTVE